MNRPTDPATDPLSQKNPEDPRAVRADSAVEFGKDDVDRSIPYRFEKIVLKNPDRIAVKTETQTLTYSALNALANQVAHAILRQRWNELGPVGLLLGKGAPLIACMLGVLKAGKFFVLVDPSFPKARMAAVLEDSHAPILIFSRDTAPAARDIVGSCQQILEFDSLVAGMPRENLNVAIPPQALALIVHTSGSTGQPKGVTHSHRSVLHDIRLRTLAHRVCARDRLSLLAAGTSSAINNTFLALLNGAALLPFNTHKEGAARLANFLSQEAISVCWISSPLFRQFVATLTGDEQFPDLRLLRLASDTVYKTDVDLYKRYFGSECFLANGIAPTETGLLRTYIMHHETEIVGSEVPLGYPVEDKEILLLDDTGKEVGVNQIGEIAVRSSYLSAGYWQNPELTKSKFVSDPKSSDGPMYLTGDLGMLLPDGCLVYKGRKDFRVKIRGYGVDIAEVEKCLLRNPAIRETVVIVRPNESGESILVAYFTPAMQPCPNVSEFRAFLARSLPDYMIPSAFVMLDAMPIAPNGKINREGLPPYAGNSRPSVDTPFVLPRTSTEAQLLKIWSEVLHLNKIGIQDNFFDLGGDSLLATQILSRVRTYLEVDLSPSTLFDKGSIVDLAEAVLEAKKAKS